MNDRPVPEENSPVTLRRELKGYHLFALSFGSIVGTGWITGVGIWLNLAGTWGAVIGFALGGAVISLIGLCYAQLAIRYPRAGGEISYSYEMWGIDAAFICGWLMVLIYVSAISFQAIVVGWFIDAALPQFRGPLLYQVAGEPVHATTLVVAGALALLIYRINRNGVGEAASFQAWSTFIKILISLSFFGAALTVGDVANFDPAWSPRPGDVSIAGIWAVFATTPFFLGGFDVVPLAMGERAESVSSRAVHVAIVGSVAAAVIYYSLVILSVSASMERGALLASPLPAIAAFEHAFGSALIAKLILVAGMLGVFSCWNASLFASGRVLYALGESRLLPKRFGKLDPVTATPTWALLFAVVAAMLLVPFGRGVILPIVNTSGSALALVALIVAVGLLRLHRSGDLDRRVHIPGGIVTIVAAIGGAGFVLTVGLFEGWRSASGAMPIEWALLLGWCAIGGGLWALTRGQRATISEEERRWQLLGH